MIGSILGGAFRLVVRRPGSVAIWAILYLVGIFAIGLLRVLMTPAGATGADWSFSGFFAATVTQLLMLGLIAILLTAVCRATLHPYKTGKFYLRLGGNELRVFALLLMLAIASAVAMFLLGLASQMILWGISAAVGGPEAMGRWPQVILGLLVAGAVILVQVRLSIALPLTYLYEQITVDEAWTLSHGHFWSLFGAFVAISLLLLAGWIIVMLIFFWPVVQAVLQSDFSPDMLLGGVMMMLVVQAMNLSTLSQIIVMALVFVLIALGFVLVTATLASVARELLGLKEGQLPDLSRRG
ncbi:hypothetical protein IAG41_18250 [Sphingomonas sp. JC676]|uniref:hypothetical protein n=1 Tax=Sphingomonas sp. JC676 TaxID=2768065 RepID=UPI001657C1FC|nr:hypothetical protein [Sphingomonas sp. JC676]MBC9034335.1 hypothetical protein [Sphingomonas sp. JC676]